MGPLVSSTLAELAKLERKPVTEHADLLHRIAQQKDKNAFEQLFTEFGPKVKALMMKQNANSELAEDIMQETMLTVWNKAHQFSVWRGSVGAWVFTIARNKRIDRFRKQGTRHYVDIGDYDVADDAPDGEDLVLSVERDSLVAAATRTLPAEQAEIIAMSFVENLTHAEIAHKLGVPLGTVKSRMRLAYAKVKKKLEDVL